MKISPFTFQTEFGLAPDHSAGAPLAVVQSEHAPPEKISTRPQPLPWRSLREHMVTWLWDARGLDVLRLLFPVKRFKPLGYDRSLWCWLSIERGNKGEREGERGRGGARCSGDGSVDAGWRLVTRRESSLWSHSRGGRRSVEPLLQRCHANKGKIKDRGWSRGQGPLWRQDYCQR